MHHAPGLPSGTPAPRAAAQVVRARRVLGVAVIFSLLLTACGGSGGQNAAATQTSSGSSGPWRPPPCRRPAPSPVQAVRVPGVASDWTITSFDGTKIRAHWFPASGATSQQSDPTLLMGPGWGMAGATKSTTAPSESDPISVFNDAGYNVLTWDPRGFGQSTGTIEVDSPDYEARDVSRLIDWVATLPGVELDAPGDPRMGMVGGSYGGGIQFVTAAQDCRVDAIVPEIAWHSLAASLDKADTPKIGWSNLLYLAAPASHLDPHITEAYDDANATGVLNDADRRWFIGRGPGDLVRQVKVPTLIVQGTVDTLFTLDEGVTNYHILKADGVPVHMIWFCGGHGICLTEQGDPDYVQQMTLSWLDRWVKRDRAVSTGPQVDVIDQNGRRYAADDYPVPSSPTMAADGTGTLQLVASGGSGPLTASAGNLGPLGPFAGRITPAKASNAVNVPIPAPARPSLVVGAPQLTLTYRGTVPAGSAPTRVFAQLVDDRSGLVVDNQITPIVVTLDGRSHTTTVPLEIVSQATSPSDSLTLQLVATTVAYVTPRLGGAVTFDHIHIVLPVARDLAP
jgi:ABC-2 type transport system ATP-binding protein